MGNICICGRKRKLYKNCKNVFKKTCGDSECVTKMRKMTNLDRYGHVNNLHSEEGRNKVRNTLKCRYGENITNVSQVHDIKEKKKNTCRKNFGVDHPMQSKQVMDKSKKTVEIKYGVDNVSKSKDVIKKIRDKMFEIDEDTGLTRVETSQIKRENTYLESHGLKHFFQTEEFKTKLRNTMLSKYGTINYFSSDSFLELVGRERVCNKSEFKLYSGRVRSITEKTFRVNFDTICMIFFRGKEYHLDHIYSVYDGFINDVDPEIIASLPNLQLLERSVNLKKSSNSWQTLDELVYLYNNLKK
jgi:hypothetical protein